MGYSERQTIIEKIEEHRGSKVVCYLTSLRPNVNAQISQDAVRTFFDHLKLLPERPVKKLDLFLCSNGGDGTVPWRLVSLFREFAEHFAVLLPYRAYSAATMLALGANEIVMHPFAEMGPIDPTVTNDFNPDDAKTGQRLGISVEDVKAYVSFVKDTVGIRHEDELIKAVEILANRVHPLALGNVERFLAQSRLIARKLLGTHMTDDAHKHKIEEIIETLASKLYFHGHPINRVEAAELGLKVSENPQPELEELMWKLYLDYEALFDNSTPFDPMADIFNAAPAPTPVSPPPAVAPGVMPAPPVPLIPVGTSVEVDLKIAAVESGRRSSLYEMRRRFTVVGQGALSEPLVRQENLSQGWTSS